MKETIRNEIVRRHYTGASQRAIARMLGLHRKSVFRVLKNHKDGRDGIVEKERVAGRACSPPGRIRWRNSWSAIPT